jgi:catechol 2,3-dioxygenase-like lactoylglutathione lyase family enzyme
MKFLITIILSTFTINALTQNVPGSNEFSKPTIQMGVVVSDLQKSLDFYKNVIGMKETGAFTVSGEKSKNLGLSDGRELDVKVLKLEDDPNANEWKLLSFGKDANHPKQNYVHDDTGIQYITIFVNNISPFLERVKSNNIKILSDAPSELGGGNYFLLIQDPDGTFIELIGPKQ